MATAFIHFLWSTVSDGLSYEWPYTERNWLYCDYFIWCASCTVVVWICFVMYGYVYVWVFWQLFGWVGNMCTCIYSVMYCLYCVFVLFVLCFCIVYTVFLYCLYRVFVLFVPCFLIVCTVFLYCFCVFVLFVPCFCIVCTVFLYCSYCVFVLFRLWISILICFVCTSVRPTSTDWQLSCSK